MSNNCLCNAHIVLAKMPTLNKNKVEKSIALSVWQSIIQRT
ncbi:hypothetical protein PFLA_a2806 [Pseudoalteromonas flavipulchra NCIMB 2033 = ATCC BAA-314]|nr:hypothetical protein [Pseudoalteromonas flavipulchra NCIMB 2033 = ATCC BAA-314]